MVIPGTDFLSHPHTTGGFFFLLTIKYCILKRLPEVSILKRLPEVPEYPEMGRDMMTSLDDYVREFQYNQCTASCDSLGKIRFSIPG